ncbi:SDR family NAD(P)-dependent oxidoreductase [Dactylosporangium cerinum]|uniref:SDR family NAD(P)-dependent oxidoreductase n=1 Tax=Dactylosporangium cerinum TaxID=1434730 RepID=A0ABV9WJV1_9ACTN
MSPTAGRRSVRRAIITGISRGLGAALFDVLNDGRTPLLGIGRTFTDAQHRTADQSDGLVTLRTTDLSDPDQLPTRAELTAFTAGCAGDDELLLIHNAATIGPIGLVGRLDDRQVQDALATNLLAPALLTNSLLYAAPAALHTIRILFISSAAAHRAYAGWATYCATKAGAEVFMRCIAETAPRPCTVEIIDPGAMETEMQQAIRTLGHGLPGHERLVERHRLGQIGDANIVAQRIASEHLTPPAELLGA